MKIFKPKYSGDKSKKFWKRVRTIDTPQYDLYALSCALQNIEGYMLEKLNGGTPSIEYHALEHSNELLKKYIEKNKKSN